MIGLIEYSSNRCSFGQWSMNANQWYHRKYTRNRLMCSTFATKQRRLNVFVVDFKFKAARCETILNTHCTRTRKIIVLAAFWMAYPCSMYECRLVYQTSMERLLLYRNWIYVSNETWAQSHRNHSQPTFIFMLSLQIDSVLRFTCFMLHFSTHSRHLKLIVFHYLVEWDSWSWNHSRVIY